jgi:sterol desaturase/sphingolipid hydroxylase (fatty acid hydroxylase superfamily)
MGVILAANGMLMGGMIWAFHSKRYEPHLFRPEGRIPMKPSMRIRMASFNVSSLISLLIVFGITWIGWEFFFDLAQRSWGWGLLSGVLVLLVYDFGYYFFHRAMHHKKLIRYVHAVHHKALFPSAFESLYVHPLETALGVLLLMASLAGVALIQPLHPMAFAATFFVYSVLNIMIHGGIRFPRYPLAIFNGPAESHFKHHLREPRSNYASFTPIWDTLLGTKA